MIEITLRYEYLQSKARGFIHIFRDEIAYKEQDNITYRHFHVLKILS